MTLPAEFRNLPPVQIWTQTIGVRMRDDRCPFFNGKHVLSKNKQEKI